MEIEKKKQMSESLIIGIILALAGGLMDAYSYLQRDGVFANAQTGNILLLGVHLSSGEWMEAFRYLCPVLAFTAGIAVSDLIRAQHSGRQIHWRQISVLMEALILIIVAFIPASMNLPANSLTSFACGIQVESFRKIQGKGIATTMCIGNLRSATQNLCDFWIRQDKNALKNGMLYLGIIICFVSGAILGNILIGTLHQFAILGASVLQIAVCIIMFVDGEAGNSCLCNKV